MLISKWSRTRSTFPRIFIHNFCILFFIFVILFLALFFILPSFTISACQLTTTPRRLADFLLLFCTHFLWHPTSSTRYAELPADWAEYFPILCMYFALFFISIFPPFLFFYFMLLLYALFNFIFVAHSRTFRTSLHGDSDKFFCQLFSYILETKQSWYQMNISAMQHIEGYSQTFCCALHKALSLRFIATWLSFNCKRILWHAFLSEQRRKRIHKRRTISAWYITRTNDDATNRSSICFALCCSSVFGQASAASYTNDRQMRTEANDRAGLAIVRARVGLLAALRDAVARDEQREKG